MDKCPECGNEQIILVAEELVVREYSVLTGKLLKDCGQTGTNCWNYKCRCGWFSEILVQ